MNGENFSDSFKCNYLYKYSITILKKKGINKNEYCRTMGLFLTFTTFLKKVIYRQIGSKMEENGEKVVGL